MSGRPAATGSACGSGDDDLADLVVALPPRHGSRSDGDAARHRSRASPRSSSRARRDSSMARPARPAMRSMPSTLDRRGRCWMSVTDARVFGRADRPRRARCDPRPGLPLLAQDRRARPCAEPRRRAAAGEHLPSAAPRELAAVGRRTVTAMPDAVPATSRGRRPVAATVARLGAMRHTLGAARAGDPKRRSGPTPRAERPALSVPRVTSLTRVLAANLST